uniref:Uncharacterized protein n=1 Tax=Cacopsylla melanoneura TaxID=428564 RepID=A0A8D8SCM5_9HEMI
MTYKPWRTATNEIVFQASSIETMRHFVALSDGVGFKMWYTINISHTGLYTCLWFLYSVQIKMSSFPYIPNKSATACYNFDSFPTYPVLSQCHVHLLQYYIVLLGLLFTHKFSLLYSVYAFHAYT